MKKAPALAVCFCIATAGSASAVDCGRDDLDQTSMNECAYDAYRKEDAVLNARYKRIVACLKDQANGLAEAQRAWIKYRDADCKFRSSRTEGGTAHATIMGSCLASATRERAKDLKYFMTCKEGDLSCPIAGCDFEKAP